MYYIQVVKGDHYRDRAERQYVHTSHDLFSRGSVYFLTKDGEKMSAAAMKSGFVLAVNPTHITDPAAVYEKLTPMVSLDKDDFIKKASDQDRTYIEIVNQLNEETATAIKALAIDGVSLYRTQWRYYPGDTVAARTIGFVGYTEASPDALRGKYGLERTYDETLRRDETKLSVNFFAAILVS
jgi:cell division protein FtsI/penicillin-binding protein 2